MRGSAALSMAEGAAGVGSAGGADKATVAAPEALGPRAYGGVGGAGAKGHRMAKPGMGSTHRCERASERSLSRKECDRGALTRWGPQEEGPVRTRKECDRVKGTHLWRPQRKGYVATSNLARSTDALERKWPSEGYMAQHRRPQREEHIRTWKESE